MSDYNRVGSKGSGFCISIDQRLPRWYVARTYSRHEKRVNEQLQIRSVEVFLPVYRAMHRWNGRRAVVDLPLFPGYVFVRIPLAERLRVLELPGVAGLVSFQGSPAPLPDEDVDRWRDCLSQTAAEPVPYLRPGNRVRITAGPLTGLVGTIIRQNGQMRFVLSIDMIMRSVAVVIDACDLELDTAPVIHSAMIASPEASAA